MADYLVPAGHGESEYAEKRSTFTGRVTLAEDEQAAKAFIDEIRKKYHDARHNCWCYIIKDGPERYSDDGEPQGTAGIPMMEVFKKEGVTNVVCVVTRYFGGILLGSGGLLRAYTKAAKDALSAAGIKCVVPVRTIEIGCQYSDLESYKNLISSYGGTISDITYEAEVLIKASLPESVCEDFSEKYLWKNK